MDKDFNEIENIDEENSFEDDKIWFRRSKLPDHY